MHGAQRKDAGTAGFKTALFLLNALAHAGVIGGADMTVEATLTKLHYLLSQGLDTQTIREAMTQNLRGELTPDD